MPTEYYSNHQEDTEDLTMILIVKELEDFPCMDLLQGIHQFTKGTLPDTQETIDKDLTFQKKVLIRHLHHSTQQQQQQLQQ